MIIRRRPGGRHKIIFSIILKACDFFIEKQFISPTGPFLCLAISGNWQARVFRLVFVVFVFVSAWLLGMQTTSASCSMAPDSRRSARRSLPERSLVSDALLSWLRPGRDFQFFCHCLDGAGIDAISCCLPSRWLSLEWRS